MLELLVGKALKTEEAPDCTHKLIRRGPKGSPWVEHATHKAAQGEYDHPIERNGIAQKKKWSTKKQSWGANHELRVLSTIKSFTIIKGQNKAMSTKVVIHLNKIVINIFTRDTTNFWDEDRVQPMAKRGAFCRGWKPTVARTQKQS